MTPVRRRMDEEMSNTQKSLFACPLSPRHLATSTPAPDEDWQRCLAELSSLTQPPDAGGQYLLAHGSALAQPCLKRARAVEVEVAQVEVAPLAQGLGPRPLGLAGVCSARSPH